MKRKLLAILSAAVMCLSAVSIAGTAVSAEENTGDIPANPDWVPESFSEALEFENTYGATHIEDGVVCLLFSETTHESYSYEIVSTTDVMTEVSRNTYTEDSADFKYEVVVYKPFANGSFEVDLNRKFQTATFVDYSFDFYVNEDGTISETDIYAWVPDCITEYNDFEAKNGTVSVHGGYIAYYYTVGGGTGNSLIMEQNGTAEIKQIAESDCTEKVAYTEVCGTPTYSVVVYQPVSDGTVDISWKIGYEWDLENSTISEINKSYEVSENGTNITDITTPVKGDVNNDSLFDASDVKMLRKWQVNAADTKLSNWRNADLNGDEKLDVFDSCLMRRELIEDVKTQEISAECVIDSIGYSDALLKFAKSDNPSAIVTSTEELETYLSPITREETVNYYLSKYDDSFFEDNILLLNSIYQRCGEGIMYQIDSVHYNGNQLVIEYSDKYEVQPYPDIVNGLLAQVIIPKEQYHAADVVWTLTEV